MKMELVPKYGPNLVSKTIKEECVDEIIKIIYC